MAADIPYSLLDGKYKFPHIGLGTFKGNSGDDEVYEATKKALDIGYRHVDTAYVYQTEAAVGNAIREHPSVSREDVFVVSKLWQTFHQPEHRSDENNRFKCVDIPVIDTWRAMEKLVENGSVRSIGVSNFTIPMLESLLSQCSIKPSVNEIEVNPSFPQNELVEYCQEHGIVVCAYSPLGNPGFQGKELAVVDEPRIIEIAKKYHLSPQQLFLSYGLSRGCVVIPKSVTASRIKDNFHYVRIADEDIKEITEIGLKHKLRTCDPGKMWGPDNDIFQGE
ncbi:NADP-dependent oxidoreductase domain-containing protein [Absidia repens]|uniref:NADP-dependent oxidoreductase domain-containing protein n=1 Tax=Absidia repens TaxID=90262 RepID=A0A1X2IUP8_9FUNG|nr:NADP-dependent oxidoreductase domain-containing protein [Absidia repens]